MYSAISLFTGAGGMDVGFEAAGISPVIANEIMSDAADTYTANRPNARIVVGDIHDVIGDVVTYSADIIFGGPPCQGFSVAGKMDPNDARSNLIFTFLDVVEKVSPRAFVMENVKALARLDKWRKVRGDYLNRANALGYNCTPVVLSATDYGVPQKRERVFFIGIRGDRNPFMAYDLGNIFSRLRHSAPTVRETFALLGPAGTDRNPRTCTAHISFAVNPVMRRSPYAGMYFNGQGRPIDVDGYSNTLPASMGGNKTPFVDEEYLHGDANTDWVVEYHRGLQNGTITPTFGMAPERLRRITVKEAAALQTFPEDYKWEGQKSAVYKQIGNAVPCKLAEAVAKAVIAYLER